jgi:hypothetical protein
VNDDGAANGGQDKAEIERGETLAVCGKQKPYNPGRTPDEHLRKGIDLWHLIFP